MTSEDRKSHRFLLKDSSPHESSGDLKNEGHQIFRDLCSVSIFRLKWVMNNLPVPYWWTQTGEWHFDFPTSLMASRWSLNFDISLFFVLSFEQFWRYFLCTLRREWSHRNPPGPRIPLPSLCRFSLWRQCVLDRLEDQHFSQSQQMDRAECDCYPEDECAAVRLADLPPQQTATR